MKKGKLIAALVTAGLLVIPFSVFAAASDSETAKNVRGFFRIDTSDLSAAQKSDAAGYSQRIANLQKEFIDKMVQNGTMTKENGDAAKKRIDDDYKASQDNHRVYGFTPGHARQGNFGPKAGADKFKFDTSKLTDQQKADIDATAAKIDDLNRTFIDTAVNDGLLTKTEGDSMKAKLDAIKKDGKGKTAGMAGRGWFGLHGKDKASLTDQQKKDLSDYSQKLSGLRKELVDKYVAAGVITREQGDAMLGKTNGKPGMKPGTKPGTKFKKDADQGQDQGVSPTSL